MAIFPVSVRYMADNEYDVNDGIEDGDVYAVSDGLTGGVPHPGDFYSFVPICVDGEIVAWAIGPPQCSNGSPTKGIPGRTILPVLRRFRAAGPAPGPDRHCESDPAGRAENKGQ